MNLVQLIQQKRSGQAHSPEDIATLVHDYATGTVPDYQMSAWAMAVCWRGMSRDETVALTRAMLESGETLASENKSFRVDKHSTGGIGDKTSFILAPLLACCGLKVPMISGRGLGATGGTLDKIESITGVRTDLSRDEIEKILTDGGCVITGATTNLVPADRKFYALRDVTGTVPSIPLITASILSKKLAEQLSTLVLDVKFGSGAFMKTRTDARRLAESLVEVGHCFGLETTALLTAMDQPNGRMVGNGVEIDESLEVLAGRGPDDLRELVLALASEVVLMKSLASDGQSAKCLLIDHLDSGRALNKFVEMIEAQGGDLDAPRSRAPEWTLTSPSDGFIARMDAERLGLAIVEMGGGRKRLGDPINFSIGMEMAVRLGDRVERGQPLIHIFAPSEARERATTLLESCIKIEKEPAAIESLVAERICLDTAGRAIVTVPCSLAGEVQSARQIDTRSAFSIDSATRQSLVEHALAARNRAYAPYSQFCVGAAVLTESRHVYTGGNIENASFGLTICAERSAIATALAAGGTSFMALAVAAPGGAAPCGACRQFIAEFCRELPIILIDADRPSAITQWWLTDLLPGRFDFPQRESNENACHAGRHEASERASEHSP